MKARKVIGSEGGSTNVLPFFHSIIPAIILLSRHKNTIARSAAHSKPACADEKHCRHLKPNNPGAGLAVESAIVIIDLLDFPCIFHPPLLNLNLIKITTCKVVPVP